MYHVSVTIEGTAPLLQHAFPATTLAGLMEGSKRKTGASDYSMEWLDTMYATRDGVLYQPATHIEGAMVKAATSFKVKGGKGKTYKDAMRAYCLVTPQEVLHIRNGAYVEAPDETLLLSPTDTLSVNVMRVVVQRAAVARARLQIAAGWQLQFCIEVTDEQMRPDVVQEILTEAGRAVGIGDFRPKYGRFTVQSFQVIN